MQRLWEGMGGLGVCVGLGVQTACRHSPTWQVGASSAQEGCWVQLQVPRAGSEEMDVSSVCTKLGGVASR